MGLGKIVSGIKRTVSFKRRKPPKTASGLPAEAGELPEDPKRLILCRKAFEQAVGIASLYEDLAQLLALLEDTTKVGVAWPAMAPLTPAERAAVSWRVRAFILARREAGQTS